jgi:class III poly(R)-hydroxyalkanoic acid synthase PhaE subunit
MSENTPWTDQWFKAQQQFVDAWSDMAKSASGANDTSHADLWAQGFDLWRQSLGGQKQPDIEQAMQKCMDIGREYFAMAEQVSKSLADGSKPVEAVNQWMEQMKQALQQFSGMPGFDAANVSDFMKQWFSPTRSWQQMVSELTPMNQAAWQLPGMNTSVFNMGEAIDPIGKILSAPGIGYFREPQEKQQRGMQLALEYNEANFKFNQAFLRVAIESIQGFQQRLMKLDVESTPKSLRQLYDLWVEVSEEHYAEFAMSEEYQALYGDMVNRLMVMKKHYHEMTDDLLRSLNLPNTREVDTMQHRLQQLRRENIELRREIGEIKAMLKRPAAKTAAPQAETQTASPPAKQAPAKKAAAKKATAKKAAAKKKASKPKSTAGA